MIGYGLVVSFFALVITMSTAHNVIATPDSTFGPGDPRFEAAREQLLPEGQFPQFDPENPTEEIVLPQETKEYTNVYFDCTDEITTEMEQPCNRLMLYLAGECENDDMWLFCGEELDNYLRNHDLEGEEFLKQTDIYEDYKLLNRLLVEQMADMPFEQLVTRLEANQTS